MIFAKPLPAVVRATKKEEAEAVAVLGVEKMDNGIAVIVVNGNGQIYAMPPGSVKVQLDKELRECIAEAELQKP